MKREHLKYYLAASVALMTLLLYLPALKNDFVTWDDNEYVYENPFIRSFNVVFLKRAFFDFVAHNWHPLTWISHALDYALWGLNPLGHHLTNIVLHAFNTFLVVVLVIKLFDAYKTNQKPPQTHRDAEKSILKIKKSASVLSVSQWRNLTSCDFTLNARTIQIAAGITGLLFGLHPLHVESVAWVAERKDLLCALFFLLSIITYTNYVSRQKSEDSSNDEAGKKNLFISSPYLFTLGFFILALLSKPMAVTLPVVLLLLDWYPFNRIGSFKTLRPTLAEKLPFIALSLLSSIVTILAQATSGAIQPTAYAPFSTRIFVAAKALIAYLWKMMLPLTLVPYYPYPENQPLVSFENLAPIVLVAGITVASLIIARKQKVWLVAWGYYAVTLLPVIGIVQVGMQSMADRYTYLPSLGPFFVTGLGAAWFWEKARMLPGSSVKLICLVTAASIILCLSFATVKQIGVWKNGIVMWSSVIERYPKIRFAYNNRGMAYDKMGLFDKAIEDFDTAIALAPYDSEAYTNRGMVLGKTGRFDKAIEDLEKAIALNPSPLEAYITRNTLGVVYAEAGQVDRAFEQFNKAILMDQDHAMAYNNRGLLYVMTGDQARAELDYQKACDLGDNNGCNAFNQLSRGAPAE
ncbi:MAG TPA: tetratricopeptide repeat protein [Nitrospirota bacterium]|nr:tetratricopeptide repeat protein [Nitrospirota bacterium]